MKRRSAYAGLLPLLIVAGLASRRVEWFPSSLGDALWAATLFCVLRIVWPRLALVWVTLISLAISFAVEFSQLLRFPWLVSLRSTLPGHLLLGQGFLWSDLVAYALGLLLMYALASVAETRS